MAFPRASGYNNLPNGNFSPEIFSKKAQVAFRKKSVCEAITNNNYFGEISNYGDSVRIIKEPDITISSYVRGQQVTPQDLDDEDFTLVIDQANKFSFRLDDIEEIHSHIDFMDMASDRGAYKLKDAYDRDVLGYMTGFTYTGGVWAARTSSNSSLPGTVADPDNADSFTELRSDLLVNSGSFASGSDPLVMGVSGTFDATPLQVLNRMSRLLDQLSVPSEGRWVVIDPVFKEKLMDENSKLVNADYNGGDGGEGLNNGRLAAGKIRGFRIYESNNLPSVGTGPGTVATTATRDGSNYGVISAGHDSAVATASQINKTEKLRDQHSFADIVRGLHLYGRKILRPEALVRAHYNVNA